MQEDNLRQSLRDGSYYTEARKWYNAVIMALISERFFYIILTTIALTTLAMAVNALIGLLPIRPVEPFILKSRDVVYTLPLIHPLTQGKEDNNLALRRYFVGEYVLRREEYFKEKYVKDARHIMRHSDRDIYETHLRYYDTSNPASPIVRYGTTITRQITLRGVQIREGGKSNEYLATVDFRADEHSFGKIASSNWTAEITFEYQDIVVKELEAPKDGRSLQVVPMRFMVTNYQVKERLAR